MSIDNIATYSKNVWRFEHIGGRRYLTTGSALFEVLEDEQYASMRKEIEIVENQATRTIVRFTVQPVIRMLT